jgi:hypothetical protein
MGNRRINTLTPDCKSRSGGLGETPSRRRLVAKKIVRGFPRPPLGTKRSLVLDSVTSTPQCTRQSKPLVYL